MLKPADCLYEVYVWAASRLTLSAAVLVCAMLVFINRLNPEGYPDPFTAYDAIEPGMDIRILAPFECYPSYSFETSLRGLCYIEPVSDIFNQIEVIETEGNIERITFYGRRLQMVDLVNRWGKPDVIQQHQHFAMMSWNIGVLAQIASPLHPFNYQSRVEWVTLLREYTTVESQQLAVANNPHYFV